MNVITNSNNLEVRTASSSDLLRTSKARMSATRTGNIKTALYSAISDIEEMGEGAAFLIIKTYPSGNTDTIKCGEVVSGRYCPRNNF